MNRCDTFPPRGGPLVLRLLARWLATACLAAALPALAQFAPDAVQRQFPDSAKRGQLTVLSPPVIELNGQPDRLSPGARIRNTENLIVMSGTLTGQPLLVNYTRDPTGLVHEVWILTPQESARRRSLTEPSAPAR